jgi:hypothetical protein
MMVLTVYFFSLYKKDSTIYSLSISICNSIFTKYLKFHKIIEKKLIKIGNFIKNQLVVVNNKLI